MQDYNIRSTNSDISQETLFMHTNFNGILNVWSIDFEDFFEYLVKGDKPKNKGKESDNNLSEDDKNEKDEDENEEDDDEREEAKDIISEE